jgi:dihydrofolate reductase
MILFLAFCDRVVLNMLNVEWRTNMRKIISQMMVTLDGFFEGPNRELDWHVVDDEYNEYAEEELSSMDTILFGRVTYQSLAAFWQTPFAIETYPVIADKMNNLHKIVFSETLERVEWNNTRLIKKNIEEEILKLKELSGKNMVILGSSDFAVSLTELGLIDEYHIMVNPVVLGDGKPLFKGIRNKLNLKLIKTKTFDSGNVLHCYQLAQGRETARQ